MQWFKHRLAVGRRVALATTIAAAGVIAPAVQSLPVASAAEPSMVSVVPARVLETRTGAGDTTVDGQFQGIGRRGAGTTLELTVAGRGGVPGDADAAFLNVTAVSPAAPGYLTVFPCGSTRPVASNVNYAAGDVVPNAVLAKIGDNGKVCIYTLAATDIITDVNGYAPDGGSLGTIVPARVLETRTGAGDTTVDGQFQGIGRRGAGTTLELTVAGRGGVPGDADAAFLNVTAVSPAAPGYLTVFPCGSTRPVASNVNYAAGDVVPNAVLAKIGDNGKVCIYTLAATDIITDVNGYAPDGGSLGTIVPARVLETRTGAGDTTVDGQFQGIGRRGAGTTLELTVAGRGGVPGDADAAFLNVTAVSPAAPGYLTVFPCGSTRPVASNVNYAAGDVVPNAVLAKIGDNGKVCIYTLAATDIITDVNGYVSADAPPSSSCMISGTAVPTVASQAECDALAALYDSTNGDSWTTNTGWTTTTDPCTWHGVLCNASGVHWIYFLSDNQLSGSIPPEIGNLTNLEFLDLSDNKLSGSIPPEIGNLTNLEFLYLPTNQLSGSIPPEIGNLTNLEVLYLYGNQLSGPIPPEIGNLTNLTDLALFDNELSGTISPELGDLTNLTDLALGSNELTGPIPPEIGNLTELTSLTVSGNELTGPIPPEIGNLTNLEQLWLGINELTGPIPPEIGNLTNLEQLWLGINELTGPIPPEIGNLTNLEQLRLNFNQLSGDLTAAFTPLMNANALADLALYGNGCLTSSNPTLATWLTALDPLWNDDCP